MLAPGAGITGTPGSPGHREGTAHGPESPCLRSEAPPPGVQPGVPRALAELCHPARRRGPRPPPPPSLPSECTLLPGLTLIGRTDAARRGPAPGAPLLPEPASVSRSLTLLAGGSRGGSAAAARGRPLAPGELGARARQPAPAPRPRPQARCPQSLRPVRGQKPSDTLAERRTSGPRLRVAGVNVPDVARVGAASAPNAAGLPRPLPREGR